MKDIVLRKVDFLTGNDFIYDGKLPSRMIYLSDKVEGPISDPTATAWKALKTCHEGFPLVFSDMYRSPASSAEAYARKTGVAKPGYSGHNYGVSIDLAIDTIIKRNKCNYNDIVNQMVAYGWTPFQGITTTAAYKRGKEDWHFNFIGDHAHNEMLDISVGPGSAQVESWIKANYDFPYDLASIQTMLKQLKLYQGEIDGLRGKLTNDAIDKFERSWFPAKGLSIYSKHPSEEVTIRLINIVSCTVRDENNNVII